MSCTECGTQHLPVTIPIGRGQLCGDCAIRLGWHLAEAQQLADLVGLTLDQLRLAVAR